MTKYNNPITIKKDSTPYLNLSEYSGIYINKYESIGISRGIRLPINSDENQNFSLLSFQMWIRYPEEVFAENLPVVELQTMAS